MTKVHLIGNAHLDPAWFWRLPEGYAEVLATFRSALDRMNEYDDYVFTCAGAAYYSWVRESDPDMFEEIAARVREGRWIITGGWWIQPDCNLPCGESFARHALYSQRFYEKAFGRKALIGYNVDSFGHNAMIPQLIKLSGMHGYVYMRPSPGAEMDYPFKGSSFIWRSPDGTTVPAFRIPFGYASVDASEAKEKSLACRQLSSEESQPVMCFYGIGNHGGGPSRAMLDTLNTLISETGPGTFSYSSPDSFFSQLDKDRLPVFEGELQHHASGCYSAFMKIKQLNRESEVLLINAEKYSSIAQWLKFDVNTAPLTEAWKIILFNQFHDIMGGCSIRDVCNDAVEAFGAAKHAARDVINKVLQKITWNLDTSGGFSVPCEKHGFKLWEDGPYGAPLTVFNPHSRRLQVPVRTGADIHSGGRSPAVTDEYGHAVPFQRIRGPMINHDIDKWESVFIADVPPMGWRTYWVRYTDEIVSPVCGSLSCSDTHLENDYLRAEFSAATGALTRLFDKLKNRELITSPALDLVIDETDADTWAHNMFSFRTVAGAFGNAVVEQAESGSVLASLRITNHWNNSTISRVVTLYRELPFLFVSCTVTWNEAHKMLKMSFPTPFSGGEIASIPYGYIKRDADGLEQPMQNWVSLGSLGVVTDTRTAYDAKDGEVRVTALRSPLYADHFAKRDNFCELTEQGEHRFQYALTADCDPACLSALANEIINTPDAIYGTYHKGPLPLTASNIDLDNRNIIVDAVKRAEEGHGYIIRMHEAAGLEQHAQLSVALSEQCIHVAFRPHQILTLLVTEREVTKVDFTEDTVNVTHLC